jgi:hypothetical protein
MNTAKTILRRLFRVYAHIYHTHFDQICALGIEGELARTQSFSADGSPPQHQLPTLFAFRR